MKISNNNFFSQTSLLKKADKKTENEELSSATEEPVTTTPDPEYQQSVQWDAETKQPKKLGVEGVYRATWSHHQGKEHEDQNTLMKQETREKIREGIPRNEPGIRVELPPTLGHMLVFSVDGKIPSRFCSENILWIPSKHLGDRERKINEFLAGRDLILVSERPQTIATLYILEDMGKKLAEWIDMWDSYLI